jgi:hypothetical protein
LLKAPTVSISGVICQRCYFQGYILVFFSCHPAVTSTVLKRIAGDIIRCSIINVLVKSLAAGNRA